MERPVHPVAALFPMMGDQELRALADDIKANGQREAIWLHPDGSILDGRNRHAACSMAGVAPKTRRWEGKDEDVVRFVASMNLHRRHLSKEQCASIAARMADMKVGRPTRPEIPSTEGISDQATPPRPLVSQNEAAQVMNVSLTSVERARAVQAHAPELEPLVLAGEMSLSKAASVARERARETQSDDDTDTGETAVRIPETETKSSPVLAPPCNGMQFARMAVLDLEQIRPDDEERAEALAYVKEWIDARS